MTKKTQTEKYKEYVHLANYVTRLEYRRNLMDKRIERAKKRMRELEESP